MGAGKSSTTWQSSGNSGIDIVYMILPCIPVVVYNTNMENLADLLKNKSSSEPPQVSALKKYAKDNYKIDITVRVSPKHYLITVPNSSLAQKFRIETSQITEECLLDKRLVIHIGS
jgi:hypothetical protein